MNQTGQSRQYELVLAGGGHTHALFLKAWSDNPLPGVNLALVSPDPLTPYSGMLPGLIAGHFAYKDIHIDLEQLCQRAGARYVQSALTGIDATNKQLVLADQTTIQFDVLSINTGSAPNLATPGVKEYAIPVKPISGFWEQYQAQEEQGKAIAVVGGGAGSVEVILAMAWRNKQQSGNNNFLLVSSTQDILPAYPARLREVVNTACNELDVRIMNNSKVIAVYKDSMTCENRGQQEQIPADSVYWCVDAAAPAWPEQSGLSCSSDGFVNVNQYLQAENHESIFAAGDIAHMTHSPRPKAGVYAVRQAPSLFRNIRAYLEDDILVPCEPQGVFLSILALGGKTAVGSRGRLSFSGNWVWHWKNSIDQRFMRQFQ